MICTISCGDKIFEISPNTNVRFTQLDKSFKSLTKTYTSSTGEKVTYGVRSSICIVKFTIECNRFDCLTLTNLFNSGYEFVLTGDFLMSGLTQTKKFILNGDITEKTIYNFGKGLKTISGTFEEV